MAPRSIQPFTLQSSIKWVPGFSGNLVVKSRLPAWSGSSLEAVEPHPRSFFDNVFPLVQDFLFSWWPFPKCIVTLVHNTDFKIQLNCGGNFTREFLFIILNKTQSLRIIWKTYVVVCFNNWNVLILFLFSFTWKSTLKIFN